MLFSAKTQGSVGEFTISIYFDCKENEISLGKVNDLDHSFSDIMEEKEDL